MANLIVALFIAFTSATNDGRVDCSQTALQALAIELETGVSLNVLEDCSVEVES